MCGGGSEAFDHLETLLLALLVEEIIHKDNHFEPSLVPELELLFANRQELLSFATSTFAVDEQDEKMGYYRLWIFVHVCHFNYKNIKLEELSIRK